MLEEHVEWDFEERDDREEISGSEDPNIVTDSFERPQKRVRLNVDNPALSDSQMNEIIVVIRPIPDSDTIFENPPFKFPLRTARQVHDTETWLSQSPSHQNKIVSIIQRRLNNTPMNQALKKCFDYEIVDHFWHPKGQRRPGGTSITDLRLFNEVFEKAVEGVANIDLDNLFRAFFKNARNCLRARRSRERQSMRVQSSIAPILVKNSFKLCK